MPNITDAHKSPLVESARRFVEAHFSECYVAFVASSVLKGEGTDTSDLDIVIITDREDAPFRQSFVWEGWPVEAFVHTETSYLDFFARASGRYEPSLEMMCVEGVVLRDRDGLAARIKESARRELEAGPEPLTQRELDRLRYTITNLIDDLTGSVRPEESFFIAHSLAEESVKLVLLRNGRWLGKGKWVLRALRRFDPGMAERLSSALARFCSSGRKEDLIDFADAAMEPVGGRLFEGYYDSGKKTQTE
jgi:predicted nucleotidyltransferase